MESNEFSELRNFAQTFLACLDRGGREEARAMLEEWEANSDLKSIFLDLLAASKDEREATVTKLLSRLEGGDETIGETSKTIADPLESGADTTSSAASGESLYDGRYRIQKELGAGGFGRVLLVQDTLYDDVQRALKAILPHHQSDERFERRFRNEIHVMRSLRHPYIPQVYNDGKTAEGEFYFTMDFVEGRPFSDVLKEDGPIEPERVARILKQVVEVLAFAHGQGVVHRDLKPDNILLVQGEGDLEEVRVLDFGIAKILNREGDLRQAMTMQTQTPIGTPHYMSPEQVAGREIDGSTDMYALGILIYHLLSGRYPFKGTTYMALMAARLESDPEPLSPKIGTPWARRLVAELLVRDPARRPTAEQVLASLESVIAGREPRRKSSSRRVPIVLAAAGLLTVAAVLWGMFWPGVRPDHPIHTGLLNDKDKGIDAGPQAIGSGTIDAEEREEDSNTETDSGLGAELPEPDVEQGKAAAKPAQTETQASVVSADTTPPRFEGLRLVDGPDLKQEVLFVRTREIRLRGRVLDESPPDALQVEVNGRTIRVERDGTIATAFDLGSGEDGRYPVALEASDSSGNASSVKFLFDLDRSSPAFLDLPTPEECSTSQATLKLSFRVEDENLEQVLISGKQAAVGPDGLVNLSLDLEVGEQRPVLLLATDRAGNENKRTITVKRVPLVLPIPTGTVDLGLGLSEDGHPLRIEHTRSGLQFVYVPAGEFQDSSGLVRSESAFYLGRTEVSAGAYGRFVEERRLEAPRQPPEGVVLENPVVFVTHADAVAFADWAGARLATRDEMRWAARGKEGNAYPWGSEWQDQACNSRGSADGFDGPAPVDSFREYASWCGALNLSGNVSEWTAEGELFGGSFNNAPAACAPAVLQGFTPELRYDIGFRIALNL